MFLPGWLLWILGLVALVLLVKIWERCSAAGAAERQAEYYRRLWLTGIAEREKLMRELQSRKSIVEMLEEGEDE